MNRRHLLPILSGLLLLAFSGCAQKKTPPIFYPPEPAAPRIQHLKTLTSENDFRSAIFKEILGEGGVYRIGRAYGVAFGTDKLYVVDTSKDTIGLSVFDLNKKKLKLMRGPLKKPLDIVVGEND